MGETVLVYHQPKWCLSRFLEVSVWGEQQGRKSLFKNNNLFQKPNSIKQPFCLASSFNVTGTTMGQCARDGHMPWSLTLKHCGSCGSITYHCWENPTACLSCFTLIPYCLWRPALVKSTSHPGPKAAQVSRPTCIASLLRVWALQALLPWPLLPENGIQMGKIPKTSLRGDLAELEGSFSLKKEKKISFCPKATGTYPSTSIFL